MFHSRAVPEPGIGLLPFANGELNAHLWLSYQNWSSLMTGGTRLAAVSKGKLLSTNLLTLHQIVNTSALNTVLV